MFRIKLAPQSFRRMFLHRHQPGEDQVEELRLISPGNHAHTSISFRAWAVAPTRCKVSAEMLAEQPDRPDVAQGEGIGRCRVVGLRHQVRPRTQPVGGFVRGNAGVLLRKDRIAGPEHPALHAKDEHRHQRRLLVAGRQCVHEFGVTRIREQVLQRNTSMQDPAVL